MLQSQKGHWIKYLHRTCVTECEDMVSFVMVIQSLEKKKKLNVHTQVEKNKKKTIILDVSIMLLIRRYSIILPFTQMS